MRELRNAIERALLLETTDSVQVSNLPPQLAALVTTPTDSEDSPHPLSLQEAERRAVVHALEAADWNITKAAQVLNVNRVTLYRKLRKYNLLAEK
ncbi:MAG: hypothetical protein F4184_02060 [Gemmatimonadetes bacterium]|nr:hypothetical protein [Gemmatimonadota bacterium]